MPDIPDEQVREGGTEDDMYGEVLIGFKTNIANTHLCPGKWGNPPTGTVGHHHHSYSHCTSIKKTGSFHLCKSSSISTLLH